MTVRAYPVYRESGSSWFDRLPSEWKCLPFKAVVSRLESGTSVNSDDRPVEGEELGVLKTSCVYTGAFDARENKAIMPAEYSRASCPIRVNHLIVSRMNTPDLIGAAGLVTQPADNLYLPDRLWQIGLQGAVPKFTHYWTRSVAYKSQVQAACSGTSSSMQNLSQPQLLSFHFPCPSVIEQSAIAAFLDRETGKIDALVAEQERLIALLKEKRQAVISHAVTKGLNPDAPMKDSGVPWLGKVPAHWEVKRVKHCLRSLDQGWSPQCEGYPVDSPDEWGVLKVGCVNGGIFDKGQNKKLPHDLDGFNELTVERGDVLISRANTRDLVGSAALVPQDHPRLMLSDKLYRLRLNDAICSSEFLTLYLNSRAARGQIELKAGGASQSMLNISQDVIADMNVPFPPVYEQKLVTTRLSASLQAIDILRTQATRAIALLRERRAALISAAVTGKIDVRDTVPAPQHAA